MSTPRPPASPHPLHRLGPSSGPKGSLQVVMCSSTQSIPSLPLASHAVKHLDMGWMFSQRLSRFFLKAALCGWGYCSHITDGKPYRGHHLVKRKLGAKPKRSASLSLCSLTWRPYRKRPGMKARPGESPTLHRAEGRIPVAHFARSPGKCSLACPSLPQVLALTLSLCTKCF